MSMQMLKNLALGLCAIAPWGEADPRSRKWTQKLTALLASTGNFDPDVSYHLVLPTLGIVVAFGVSTWVAFPSALIPHGDLHGGHDFEVRSTKKGEGFDLTGKAKGQIKLWVSGHVLAWDVDPEGGEGRDVCEATPGNLASRFGFHTGHFPKPSLL